jgi:hypothetical protein
LQNFSFSANPFNNFRLKQLPSEKCSMKIYAQECGFALQESVKININQHHIGKQGIEPPCADKFVKPSGFFKTQFVVVI